MSLPMVLLSALSIAPSTGYDLTRRFDGFTGLYWTASHQQVYRDLTNMVTKGFVNFVVEPQNGKPDRKVYSVTYAGVKALSEWRATELKDKTVRKELIVKLMLVTDGNKQDMIRQLNWLISDSNKHLCTQALLIRTSYGEIDSLSTKEKLEYLALRHDMLEVTSHLDWAEEALYLLRRL
jgi:PadR family transcriptional regulator AphA